MKNQSTRKLEYYKLDHHIPKFKRYPKGEK